MSKNLGANSLKRKLLHTKYMGDRHKNGNLPNVKVKMKLA